MNFFSIYFLFFFLVFTIILSFVKEKKWQHVVFLCANVVFYSFWNIHLLTLLGAVILVCYTLALLYEKYSRIIFVHIGVVACICTLGIFKYLNFFIASFAKVFGINDYVTLHLILPLGISFYLFQAMSYLFDVKQGKIRAEHNFIKLAAYISFFPQITSGPIVKSKDFLPQLDRVHKISKKNVSTGVQLFLTGLTKKLVFADRIGVAVDAVFAAPKAYNSVSIFFAIIGYALQIYCDFSGYSDMAIGIAKIWDFDLGKNFNAPYLAQNPTDFWRRWHISLSSWFRDYVYIPLGGNRKGRLRTYFNLFITMVLSGVWHGASVTYIVWGAVHGIGSAVNKLYREMFHIKGQNEGKLTQTICILVNNLFICFTWIIFRANSLGDVFSILRGLADFSGITYVNIYVIIFAIIIGVINALSMYINNGDIITINLNLERNSGRILFAVWILLVAVFMYCGNSAFIYAQF